MARYRDNGEEQYMGRRWGRYFAVSLKAAESWGWTRTRLARDALGGVVPPSRITAWSKGESPPGAELAFKVGEALRCCGFPSSGFVSLYAGGRYVHAVRLLREISREDKALAVRLYCRTPHELYWIDDVKEMSTFEERPSLAVEAGKRLDIVPPKVLRSAWERVLKRMDEDGVLKLPVTDAADHRKKIVGKRPLLLGPLENRAWIALESAVVTYRSFSRIPEYEEGIKWDKTRESKRPPAALWTIDFEEVRERLWYQLREWAVYTDAHEYEIGGIYPHDPVETRMSILRILRQERPVVA